MFECSVVLVGNMEFGNYKDSIQLLNQKKSANCRDCFFASPFIKYVLPSFLVVLLLLTFSYFGLLNWLPLEDPTTQATCHLQPNYHVPCAPGRLKIGKDECLELGCCWREDLRRCYHSYPSRYGYKVHAYQTTSDGLVGNITASKKYSPTGKPSRDRLDFHVRQIDDNNFQISLKESLDSRSTGQRFATFRKSVEQKKLADYGHLFDFLPRDDEVRITEFSLDDNSSTKVLLHQPNFSLTIIDSSTNVVILSTACGPLIITDEYWELTLHLADGEALQGLGNLELNGTTNWIYNNERRTIEPVLLALGANVGCRIQYQGPLEIQVLNGSNLVILRGISIPDDGLTFDLHIGSDPLQTIRQLSNIRSHPQLLSLNRLGLHICPDHHVSLESAVESLKNLVDVGPWDSHCISRRHLGPTLEHEANLELVAEASRILVGRTIAPHLTPMVKSSEDVQRVNDKKTIVEDDRRIVGGYKTSISKHPYQVFLRYNGRYRCGGAIISEEWIVTAAHCLRSVFPSSLSIKAGSSTLSGRGQVVSARQIILHEDYSARESDFDIAVIQLDSPLEFNRNVQPIDLASQSDEYAGEATVSGWGVLDSKGDISNQLRQTSVTLLSNDECQRLYGRKRITGRMLCAGTGGSDACQGDSGGPLVQDGRLIGVVSWGFGCAEAAYPGVYTRVTALRAWISEKTGL